MAHNMRPCIGGEGRVEEKEGEGNAQPSRGIVVDRVETSQKKK